MAGPLYRLAKAPYCRAFANKIHRGYLRRTAILPIHKLKRMLRQPLLPGDWTEIDHPDTAADPIKVGLDYQHGILLIN